MKKRVLSMLMVMIMMVSMLSVSVFADGHVCDYADSWSNGATNHWHACEEPGCTVDVTALPDYAAHVWGDDSVCDTCGYTCQHSWVKGEDRAVCFNCKLTHEHTFTTKNNDTHHWKVCENCLVDSTAKYGETVHTLVQNGTVNQCSGCDYKEHVHVWKTEWVNTDADAHWHECEDSACPVTDNTAKSGYAQHTWTVDSAKSTATDTYYVCVCGATDSTHTHKWSSDWTTDGTYHWYACSGCNEVSSKAIHLDANNSGRCDDCKTAMSGSKTLTNLDIIGLTEPADGATVDFYVSVSPADTYGAPSVAWNKVVSLSKNTSEALGSAHTYAGGEMYNTCISIPVAKADKLSDDFSVTLNGKTVEFYTSKTTANKVVATYDGKKTVSLAYRDVTSAGYAYIRVCVMYAELPEGHEHVYTSDWVESAAKHYLLCTGCGDTKDSGKHYDDNNSGLCDVCGYDMKYYNPNATANSGTGSAAHTHTYSADWVEDISNHWKQCTGCGAKTSLAAHADLNNTGKCDICGFVMKAADGHTHTFAADWTETFAQHYKVCSCGAKNEIAAHADLNNTGKCDVCGYAMTTLVNNGIVADTGDNNAAFMWAAALIVALAGFAGTIVYSRKKREE